MPETRLPDIKGFLETSFLDWPGQVVSVLFLAGCNFRCPFCHNHGLVLRPDQYNSIDWEAIKNRLAKFTGWIDGVVFTGGEPTLSPTLDVLIGEVRSMGFRVKLDTNGGRPRILKQLLRTGLVDHVAMDIKAPLDELSYARAAGVAGVVERVRESLQILADSSIPFTLRTTAVPALHTRRDIIQLAEQLKAYPEWKLQNFEPENALDESFRDGETWSADEFEELKQKAGQVHTGEVPLESISFEE